MRDDYDKITWHRCPMGNRVSPEPVYTAFGQAIERIGVLGKTAFATNDEYTTNINFCPWCGAKLVEPPTREELPPGHAYVNFGALVEPGDIFRHDDGSTTVHKDVSPKTMVTLETIARYYRKI